MTDIVERLRDPEADDFHRCRYEAADEIERLRERDAALTMRCQTCEGELERLRAALESNP